MIEAEKALEAIGQLIKYIPPHSGGLRPRARERLQRVLAPFSAMFVLCHGVPVRFVLNKQATAYNISAD